MEMCTRTNMTLACVEQNLKTKSTFDSYDLLSGTSLQPLRTPRGPQILGEVSMLEALRRLLTFSPPTPTLANWHRRFGKGSKRRRTGGARI